MGGERTRPFVHAVPLTFALVLLAVVVLTGLLPNTGDVAAASNCTYGQCPASSSFPVWEVSAAAILAVLAVIVALLLIRRRRRQPPAAGGPPPPASPRSEVDGGPNGSEEAEPPYPESEGSVTYEGTPERDEGGSGDYGTGGGEA